MNNMQDNLVHILAFFMGLSLLESNRLKKIFAKKNSKRVIDKDLLNISQATDKAKSRAEIDALLACLN